MISPILNDVVSGRAPELMTFSVELYHRLTESGVLLEGSPVELIDGVIVYKDRRDAKGSIMNHGPKHAFALTRLFQLLNRELESVDCHIRCQMPVTLTSNTEPEPDLAVVAGTANVFFDRHPGPGELLAVVEVAYSSRVFDRTTKQRIYAAANIPVYWIVNLTDRRVEVFEKTDAATGKYQSTSTVGETGQAQLSLADASSVVVSVADFLPPATA